MILERGPGLGWKSVSVSQEMPLILYLGRWGGIRMGSIFQEEGAADAKVLRQQELGILKDYKKVPVAGVQHTKHVPFFSRHYNHAPVSHLTSSTPQGRLCFSGDRFQL